MSRLASLLICSLDVSTGLFSNPHDVIAVSPTKAYVLRYERNETPTPDPDDHDEGDDLLIIDPSVPAITGRIDLSSYAVQVTGTNIQARLDRGLLIDGKRFVVLSNLSADFQVGGNGRVLVIDPATDRVTDTIDLPEFKTAPDRRTWSAPRSSASHASVCSARVPAPWWRRPASHTSTPEALAAQRLCSRVAFTRSLSPTTCTPGSWGLRFWNGAGEQMLSMFLPSPFLDDRQRPQRDPDWSRLQLRDELRARYLGETEPQPLPVAPRRGAPP